ncbi:MAG: amidohydrolase [Thermovirgaceae bacterium]
MPKGMYLYLRNGNIWTGDDAVPKAESVIIGDGKVLAVGATAQLDAHPFAADAVVHDLDGASVAPGMSDCHIHVLTCAKGLHSVDMSTAASLEDVLERLRERSAEEGPDAWIYGTMLNENNWDRPLLPTASDLDKAGIPNPVVIHRICTHASIANSRAMKLSGLDTMDLPGIRRDASGKATGVLVEGAQPPVHAVLKKNLFTNELLMGYLDCYLKYAASFGLTTLHLCSAASLGMEEELGLYQRLWEEGRLCCRVYNIHDQLSEPSMGGLLGNDFVRFEGFKLFLDGSLGARTAALTFPYADEPTTEGMLIHETGELVEKLCEATRRGDHIMVHAIGDRAIDQQLEAVEKTCNLYPDPKHPFLLNHVEILRPDQIERMKKLPVACVIQPTYVPSDIDMVPARLGDKQEFACVWKDLVDAGLLLCGSSDAPIEVLDPMVGIWALVNRTSYDGKRTWRPDQKLSLDQALRIYTTYPAKAHGTWKWNGSITPGKAADLVIFDRDLFAIDPAELRDVEIASTIVDGKLSWGCIDGWDFYR